MTERIQKLNMDWFLMEPAFFKVLCSHQVVANTDMRCPIRCGNKKIEYNPELCKDVSDATLEELFKIECLRILLKHPYSRQPEGCCAAAITMGSNCVVNDNYRMKHVPLETPRDFGLKGCLHFEYYAKEIQKQLPEITIEVSSSNPGDNQQGGQQGQQSGGGQQNGDQQGGQQSGDQQGGGGQGQQDNQAKSDASALWKEDPMAYAEVNEMIKVMEASNNWGSIPGKLAGKIIASTRVKIDYRKVMQSFRADILSSKRRLTRMRPNRRSGFENFGSVYKLTSRLLVAIDVSGSTTDEMVSDFFGIVNKFFKYGIEEIDVIQFDAGIKGEPEKLKKAKKGSINIVGRGGTDFQPVVNFVHNRRNHYQGLIILTDGDANYPKLPDYFNTPILWVLPNESDYEVHKSWMEKIRKSKASFITR